MSRVQLALNVADLDASVEFYRHLLGVEPHKRRPGYANFAVEQPPLKLVLIENPAERGQGAAGALNHLGIEVETVDEVDAARERIREAGLASFDENDTTCCYARQDKVWVHDPAGAPWEVYVITDDNPDPAEAAESHAEAAERPAEAAEKHGEAAQKHAEAAEKPTPCCTSTGPVSGTPAVRIYEPALCCATGVCGDDLDPDLVTFTADLAALKDAGADIARFNLATEPGAFADSETVRAFLTEVGSAGLPLTLVDGVEVARGRYLSRAELAKLAGVPVPVAPRADASHPDLGVQAVSAGDSCCCEQPAGCC